MFKRFATMVVLAVLVLGALAGCGKSAETTEGGIPADAAFKITGSVNNEIGWAEADVLAMDTMEAQAPNKEGVVSTYTGVSINTLLEKAGVKEGATTLVFVADDGYTSEVVLAEIQACTDCIISFREQGGFSSVLPGFSNKAQVKGIVEIQVK